jgi:drug/metabolite transporter (DMT)-like permease
MSNGEEEIAALAGPSRGRLLILVTAVLWSLAGVFIKSLELHPLAIVFYRSLFAGLFFVPWVSRKSWTISLPVVVSVLSYTAAISSFVSANKLTTAANAIVLQYSAPVFVFIFARLLFREAISKLNLLALIAGTVGVGIIFAGSAGHPDIGGVGVALLSGLFFSIYMTNLRFLKGTDPAYLTLANNLACCVALLPWVHARLVLTAAEAATLGVMGVVQLGIPYFLFCKGLEKVSLQEASLIVLVEPVLNPIWVALAFGEIPSLPTLTGGGIILLSLGFRYAAPFARRNVEC